MKETTRKLKILLLEEEENSTLDTKSYLESKGHQVLTTSDLGEAFHLSRQEAIDLVLLNQESNISTTLEICDRIMSKPPSPPNFPAASQRNLNEELEEATQSYGEEVAKSREDEDTQPIFETKPDHPFFFKDEMTSLGLLAAGIAHELRNPLSIIGNSVYYLAKVLEESANKHIQEHLNIIQSEIARSQRIISHLLNFSRRSSEARESVDLNQIVRMTLSLMEKNLAYRDVEVELNLSKLPLSFVNIDDIKQVFLNLFKNSLDAMPNGGQLTIASIVKDDHTISLSIKDTGIGIDSSNLDKIFDPFFSANTDESGIGLGLSLVRACIIRNKGRISVNSEKGKGTEFEITLPTYS
ncbi:MAG: ATP-binding protein [bacterium]